MEHQLLFSQKEVSTQVGDLANAIDANGIDNYLVLTVLKGAAIFSSDLVRAMRTSTELEYVTATSYANDFSPGDTLTVSHIPQLDLERRHVLVVEDIIDTGRTLQRLHQTVARAHPESITTVTLINKTNRRETELKPDHSGFDITNEFIYGYGLDWNQKYRDLPYIAIANPSDNSHESRNRPNHP